jgi:DUF1680 family protein
MANDETTGANLSRRQFVTAAISTAAVSLLPAQSLSALAQGEPNPTRDTPVSQTAAPLWREQGIENLAKSPYAKLRNIPIRAVTIQDGFWSRRRATNVQKSIPTMHDLLEAHGRMNNFRRLVGKSNAEQIGPYFADSDIYKWIDAVGFATQSGDLKDMRPTVDRMIDEVTAVQEPSGYLNTYYVGDRAKLRMLPQSQSVGHEMYNLGHMIQGAISFYRGTGDRRLLDAGIRFVNDFLMPGYGPAPKQPIVSGHPEIEMALVELYRITGDRRQLELAGYILQGDNRIQLPERRTIYLFSGTPFTERTKLEGHAVRAMYACCGATDYYLETGDPAYWKTLNTLWEDLSQRKMYISGGVGARSDGEAFGDAYELPNARAYGESCAAIGNMMWNWRMLAATGEARFTDVIERALYNGINSGMSLNGTEYCYRNPLAFDPSTGDKIRNPWYDVTCCPPNLERTLASLPGYFYSTSSDGIYVHLYDNSGLDWHLENGTGLKVAQKTNYPWDGNVQITVTPERASDFVLHLRIPGWAQRVAVAVSGKPITGAEPGEYLAIQRRWTPGDVVQLELGMPVHLVQANYHIAEDNGRVSLQRGPLLYCMEELDQPRGTALSDLAVRPGTDVGGQFHPEHRPDLLDGIFVLRHEGAVFERPASGVPLYSRYTGTPAKNTGAPLTFIPYYAWANREPTAMQVWTPVLRA